MIEVNIVLTDEVNDTIDFNKDPRISFYDALMQMTMKIQGCAPCESDMEGLCEELFGEIRKEWGEEKHQLRNIK